MFKSKTIEGKAQDAPLLSGCFYVKEIMGAC